MIADAAIEAAATWLANQWDDEAPAQIRYERIVLSLRRTADGAGPGRQVGMSVPTSSGNPRRMACVEVWPDRVYGWLDSDESKTLIWTGD